jgi:hypothetical protein
MGSLLKKAIKTTIGGHPWDTKGGPLAVCKEKTRPETGFFEVLRARRNKLPAAMNPVLPGIPGFWERSGTNGRNYWHKDC